MLVFIERGRLIVREVGLEDLATARDNARAVAVRPETVTDRLTPMLAAIPGARLAVRPDTRFSFCLGRAGGPKPKPEEQRNRYSHPIPLPSRVPLPTPEPAPSLAPRDRARALTHARPASQRLAPQPLTRHPMARDSVLNPTETDSLRTGLNRGVCGGFITR